MTVTKDEAHDLYREVAPAAFATFGREPVLFAVEEEPFAPVGSGFFEVIILAGGPVASTYFAPRGSFLSREEVADNLGHEIVLNAHYLNCLDADEVRCVILHEIAHAVGPFTDQHTMTWENRARLLHPAAAAPFFTPRRLDLHPYPEILDPAIPLIATLDLFK